ncbi:hypothetical protein GGR58DRAFT_513421 [Xylaria digitata]|nr:hypothetical protein GGR58DRAFT_513421 [Xylaria digitata]
MAIRVTFTKVQGNRNEDPVTSLKLPLQQSLGILSCITLFGGSALTLLAVAFLLFLWAGGGPVEGGSKAQPAWRIIMLHGWATQSVTLTSLLIRIISAAQAGLCTSMVAALLLERRGVPISKIVQLSVTRSVNVSPMDFLCMIMSRRVRKLALKPEVLLLFILAFTALGIQFSSTILISDFGTTRLVQNSNRTIINVAMSSTMTGNVGLINSFGSFDSSTVLFGEVDSQANPAPNQLGVSDTGAKRRAFPPFEKEDRTSLQVACIRPSITAKLRFAHELMLSVDGTINYNQSLEDAGQRLTQRCYTGSDNSLYCLPMTFNCSLPGTADPLLNPQYEHKYWRRAEQSGPVTLGEPISYGEWISNEIEPGKFLNTTLCFSAVNTTVSSLTMTGNMNQTEPNLTWNFTTGSLEADSLQTLFGADHLHKTPAQRGIFSVVGGIQDPVSPSTFNVTNTSAQDAILASSTTLILGVTNEVWLNTGNGVSVSMCNRCEIFGFGVSDDIAALFQRIINTTGRSAIAIDTYIAMLSRWWYYYLLPRFDVPGYIDAAFTTEVILPRRWRGLTVVLVLVGTNMALMWTIAALYIRRTRFTLAGNYWHAVAQLISKDTIPLLEKSGEMTDEDVTEQLDLESEDFLVKIERSTQDGLVTVAKV